MGSNGPGGGRSSLPDFVPVPKSLLYASRNQLTDRPWRAQLSPDRLPGTVAGPTQAGQAQGGRRFLSRSRAPPHAALPAPGPTNAQSQAHMQRHTHTITLTPNRLAHW